MSKKLNIGCGRDVLKDYINLDIVKLPGVDIVHNLNKYPYPFKDNEFDKIYCNHVLEHVEDLIKIMGELKRISKPNAIIKIKGPHFSCGVNYRDPTHKRTFSYFTFNYFNNSFIEYDLPQFKVIERKLNTARTKPKILNPIFNPIFNLIPATYERFLCWIFPVSEVSFKLKVIK
ncbi:MAG: class I SAM-dependent methyltransferase [Nanoarchaeota archaeon]|nr:class I SAM-dependent methyltransferase [Nanoarchaeota archaeon]